MAITLYPPTRPRTLAELLDASVKIFRVTLPKCLPYASMAILFGQLSTLYDLARGQMPAPRDMNNPVWITLYTAGSILFFILWMAMLLRQAAVAAGRPPGASDLLDALKQAPAILAICLIGSTVILLLIAPPLTLAEPYRSIGFGVMLLPAIYISIGLSLALPARMLTHKSVMQSILYSLRLIRGNWWRSAALYVIAVAIIAAGYLFTAVMVAMILPGAGRAEAAARAGMTAVVLAVGAMGLIFYTAILLSLFGDLELRQVARPPG